MMMAELKPDIIQADYLASAVKSSQYPDNDWPQLAFVGRSNVGKSSLLNSLCRRNNLARTSSTPGKTQTLNFYYALLRMQVKEERHELCLVDLPGYGYAKASATSKQQWGQFIREYLERATKLKLVIQLIDIRHAPMTNDVASYNWLRSLDLPVQVVATKADKLSRSQCQTQVALIRNTLKLGNADTIIAYSSETGSGREELLAKIIAQCT